MGLLRRAGICAIAVLAGSVALRLEPTVMRDLVLDNGSHRIAVGAVKVPLWSTARARSPDSFSIEDVKFTWGPFVYEAKRLDFSGARASRQNLERLFSSTPEPFSERLARISARQVTAPEIKVTATFDKETKTFHYRNVSMNDIVEGRIASTLIEALAIEMTGAKDNSLTSYGRTKVTETDMPAFARLFETADGSAASPLTQIYGSISIEDIERVDHNENSTLKIARVNGRNIRARPTSTSFGGTMAAIAGLTGQEDRSPEEEMRLVMAAADLLGAFDVGSLEATGLVAEADPKKGKGTGSTARIDRVSYSGSTASRPADLRIEGMELGESDNRVKIASASLTGFSIAPTLKGLNALQGKSLRDIDRSDLRTLLPTFGTLRLSGIDIDAWSTEADRPERVKLTIAAFELTADKPLNGIPTNIRIEQRNAAMSLPTDTQDSLLKELVALGYTSFDSSWRLSATWNEAKDEILLKEISLEGSGMGSVVLSGRIGNVGEDLFSTDQAVAAAALIGAKARSANVTIEDKGLFGRYLASAARKQRTTPETLRQIYADAAPLLVSSLVGHSEQARTLGRAISRFISRPGKLDIRIQSRHPSGFGIMDVMLASDPKAALEKLNITATAEE